MKAALRKIAIQERKAKKQAEKQLEEDLAAMETDEEVEEPEPASEENLALQRAAKRPRNFYKAPEVADPRKASKKPIVPEPVEIIESPKQKRSSSRKGKKTSSV